MGAGLFVLGWGGFFMDRRLFGGGIGGSLGTTGNEKGEGEKRAGAHRFAPGVGETIRSENRATSDERINLPKMEIQ